MNLDEAKALEPMTEAELQAFAVLQMFEPQRWNVTQRLLFHNAAPRLLALAAAHPLLVEALGKEFEQGIAAVIRIRCTKHYEVPAYNHQEGAGGECAACAVKATESKVAALEGQVKALREALERIEDYPDAAEVQRVARTALAAVPVQPKEGA